MMMMMMDLTCCFVALHLQCTQAESFTIHGNVRVHNCHLFIIRVSKGNGVTGYDTGGQIGQVCPISLTENWPLIAIDLSLEGNGNHNRDLSTCVSAQENYFSY